ncbi:MAG: CDP-alcohol phosphatidyltransferase family protein [Candidatus Hodarchaeota archaeon]
MHVRIPGLKKRYDQIMKPLSEFFHLKLRLHPNHVSFIGFLIGLMAVALVLLGLWQIALVITVVSLLFDGIDGNIARMYGLESKTGEKLEIIFDRSLEALLFLAFAIVFNIDLMLAFLVIYSILIMTSLRDKTRFDPGLKRIALLLGFLINYETILNLVFLVHIGSFMVQIAVLDYVNQNKGVSIC